MTKGNSSFYNCYMFQILGSRLVANVTRSPYAVQLSVRLQGSARVQYQFLPEPKEPLSH